MAIIECQRKSIKGEGVKRCQCGAKGQWGAIKGG